MTSQEKRSTAIIATLMSLRMLGLFMLLPIFTLYGQSFSGATPTTLGLALGIYGFTQACLQIPFGALSDHFGRRTIIIVGLSFFALGSLVAAYSTTITSLIIGRALQGSGAIGSPCLAYLADVTRPEIRTRTMAATGGVIGMAFMIAIVIGPFLSEWTGGLKGIFFFTLILALIGIALAFAGLNKLNPTQTFTLNKNHIHAILKQKEMGWLNSGIFITHAVFTACFIPIPLLLTPLIQSNQLGVYYLCLMVLAFFAMLPLIIWSEKRKQGKRTLRSTLLLFGIVTLLMLITPLKLPYLLGFLLLFFTTFNALEALLPSLVSQLAPTSSKGLAMGVYSTCQFLGIFIGGTVGGWLYDHFHLQGIVGFSFFFSILGWIQGRKYTRSPVNKQNS